MRHKLLIVLTSGHSCPIVVAPHRNMVRDVSNNLMPLIFIRALMHAWPHTGDKLGEQINLVALQLPMPYLLTSIDWSVK